MQKKFAILKNCGIFVPWKAGCKGMLVSET